MIVFFNKAKVDLSEINKSGGLEKHYEDFLLVSSLLFKNTYIQIQKKS